MKKTLLIFCSLLIAAAAGAQIIYVHPDSTHATIQSGIVAANPGDTVVVLDHVYFEQIDFLGKKPITVASMYILDGDTNHINNTVIDGSLITSVVNGSIVTFKSGEDTTSVLCGFTITNGTKGTKYTDPYGDVIQSGAGIFLMNSGAKIIRNHITQNRILNPAGIPNSFGGGIGHAFLQDPSWVVIEHNRIDFNSVSSVYSQAFGGGLQITCNARVSENVLTGNSATGTGNTLTGGAALVVGRSDQWTGSVTGQIDHNLIYENDGFSQNNVCAGVCYLQAITGIFTKNQVWNNYTNSGNSSGEGGAFKIYAPQPGSEISANTFSGNNTVGAGGGVHVEYTSTNIYKDTLLVEGNYFLADSANNGGAFYCLNNPVKLNNNVFSGNYSRQKGGAVILYALPALAGEHLAVLFNNSFNKNTAEASGGAISSYNGKPLVVNCILWEDQAGSGGNEISITGTVDTLEIAFSDIYSSDISGPWINGGYNINLDPEFADPNSLIIQGGPCYNAGTDIYTCMCGVTRHSPIYDIDGISRPVDNIYDIGAHELIPEGIGQATESPALSCVCSPNPCTTVTTFFYTLPESGQVTLKLYNAYGQLVAEPVNSMQKKGDQKVHYNAGILSPGIYFYRIDAGGKSGTGKLVKK